MSARDLAVVVHLNDGTSVMGNADSVTDEQLVGLQAAIAEILGTSGGWQINLEVAGNWFCFPKDSVKFVEIREVL